MTCSRKYTLGRSVYFREHRRPVSISRHAVLVAAIVSISGCATRPVVVAPTTLADRIPGHLLTCAARPAAGSLERQSDVARFVVDLDAAGEDCRRKLGAVKGIVEAEGEER